VHIKLNVRIYDFSLPNNLFFLCSLVKFKICTSVQGEQRGKSNWSERKKRNCWKKARRSFVSVFFDGKRSLLHRRQRRKKAHFSENFFVREFECSLRFVCPCKWPKKKKKKCLVRKCLSSLGRILKVREERKGCKKKSQEVQGGPFIWAISLYFLKEIIVFY